MEMVFKELFENVQGHEFLLDSRWRIEKNLRPEGLSYSAMMLTDF
jgi:hypothetical protein